MNGRARSPQRGDTLTEQQFEHCYRQALRFRKEGLLEAARDTYLLLFDRGREVGGFGVTRLSFVLDDLMTTLREIADAGSPADADRVSVAETPFAPVQARRNVAEERICTGKGGFVDAQEVVALNRALGQPARSAELYRSLAPYDAKGTQAAESGSEHSHRDAAIAAARQTLGDLIWRDIAPGEPHELARQASTDPALWSRVVSLARQVASWIAELRVREDFPGTTWVYQETYGRWLATRIEADGVSAFRLLLAMTHFEPPPTHPPLADASSLASRLQAWLLAYQPAAPMLAALTDAARRANRPDLVDQLQEEAWSLLNADSLREFADRVSARAQDHSHSPPHASPGASSGGSSTSSNAFEGADRGEAGSAA